MTFMFENSMAMHLSEYLDFESIFSYLVYDAILTFESNILYYSKFQVERKYASIMKLKWV